MNQFPKVCICIPHYNNEKTISETLDSLVNQTYKNIVIKIFDNASTDDSMKILKEYEDKYPNIKIFQNEVNIGGEANFTKCIENLEGDYGAIYHADDIYESTIVETQVKYLTSYDISAVFVRAGLIDDCSKNIGEQFFPEEFINKAYIQFDFKRLFSAILKYDNFLITPSVMARVDIYREKIKHWNGEKFKTSADLDVWLRFAEIQDIGIITDKLISYRVSSASFTFRTKFSRYKLRDMFLVLDSYLERYNQDAFRLDDYEFLKFKDSLLIVSNKILNDIQVKNSEIKLRKEVIKLLFTLDKSRSKVVLFALMLKALLMCNCRKIQKKFIQKVNQLRTGN